MQRSDDSKAFKKVSFEFGNYKLRYAWVSQRGYYPEDLDKHNQDAHVEVENFGKEQGIKDAAFFGVFDGHGKTGDHCAIFAKNHTPGALAEELAKAGKNIIGNYDSEAVMGAFKAAFVSVNKKLHDRTDIDDSMSGTTASTRSPPCPMQHFSTRSGQGTGTRPKRAPRGAARRMRVCACSHAAAAFRAQSARSSCAATCTWRMWATRAPSRARSATAS